MHLGQIVLKVASRCNLNCGYCYIYQHEDQSWRNKPKFMSEQIFEATLAAVADHCDRYSQEMGIVLHGGEPSLIGPQRLGGMAARARAFLGSRLSGFGIQTNGTMVDDDWIRVIQEHDLYVGVSLDGPPHIHDAERVDHAGRGSHGRVLAGIRRLEAAGIKPGILCVVNPEHSGAEVYRHFRDLGLENISLLLPDVSHDSKSKFYGHLGPTPVADYLNPVFDMWFEENNPDVRLAPFWDLLSLIYGGSPNSDAFGNPSAGYVVVDTNGAIEALDALRVCDEGIVNSNLNVLTHGFDDLHLSAPTFFQMMEQGFPLPSPCKSCPERSVCGGGYAPHRYSKERGFDNESVWCRDILKLLGHIRRRAGLLQSA